MTTLQGFPMVSQLTPITSDGSVPEDAQFSCVPASIGACILWHEGKSQWDEEINPDRMKDAVYGQGYVGAMSASEYVPYCASLGYKLSPLAANPAQLVVLAHQSIQAGTPVIATEPDPYVPSSYGWSHVVTFFSEGPGYLVALDPYIGRPVTRSDQDWTQLLLFNQVWTLARMEVPITITINTPGVGAYFQQQDAQHWLCPATGRIIQYGMLAFYCAYGGNDLCGLTYLGLPMSNELTLDAQGNTIQFYERCCLVYDPGRKYDNPPGSTGPIYTAHVYSVAGQTALGQDPEIAKLMTQIATLQQELATAQNGVQLAALEQRLAQIKALATA